jgi:hypothetical protein
MAITTIKGASLIVGTYAEVVTAAITGDYEQQEAIITDRNGARMYWTGSAWMWRGSVTVAQEAGLIASPLATRTSDGAFAVTITVPVGALIGKCRLRIEAYVKRTGATTAAATLTAYLGTAGTTSDSSVGSVSINQTDGHVGRMDTSAYFDGSSATSFLAGGTAAPQSSTGGGSVATRTTNVNAAAAMTVTLAMSSVNATDSYALLSFRVIVER